jgi:hypothetical protein
LRDVSADACSLETEELAAVAAETAAMWTCGDGVAAAEACGDVPMVAEAHEGADAEECEERLAERELIDLVFGALTDCLATAVGATEACASGLAGANAASVPCAFGEGLVAGVAQACRVPRGARVSAEPGLGSVACVAQLDAWAPHKHEGETANRLGAGASRVSKAADALTPIGAIAAHSRSWEVG